MDDLSIISNPESEPHIKSNTPNRAVILGASLIMATTGLFFTYVGYSQINEYDDKPRETPVYGEMLGLEQDTTYGTLQDRGEIALVSGSVLALSGIAISIGTIISSREPKKPSLHIVRL